MPIFQGYFQPFSHPLTQLPLIIGLPCETYSLVSPRKLFLSVRAGFEQGTPRSRVLPLDHRSHTVNEMVLLSAQNIW